MKLAESGHPVLRATSPLSRGQLKKKGGGKLSIHCCADLDTITTITRNITSVNQLSLYGAVADMCEEYETFHDRTGQPVVGGQSSSSFVPSVINNVENELKIYHKKTNWANFVLMQDSWLQLNLDIISWRKTMQNSHNSRMQWHVVSTTCQETKIHLNSKAGSEGTPKLGLYWKLQIVACKVNIELRSESCLWTNYNSHSWVRIFSWLKQVCDEFEQHRAGNLRNEVRRICVKIECRRFCKPMKSQSKTTKTRFCQLIHKNCT